MIKACIILEPRIAEKRVFPLYTRLTIGRASANDIFLSDTAVSKRHAALGRIKGRAVVKDLGSHNGTFVNGKRVEKAILSGGDKLQVGKVNLRFVQEEEVYDSSSAEGTTESQFPRTLGYYLIEADIIDEKTLLANLEKQKKNPILGEILISLGVSNEVDIAMALAKQLSISLIRLGDLEIHQEALSLVPGTVSKSNLLIPIKIADGKLQIAMSNPLDFDAIQIVRMTSRMDIDVAVTTQGDVLEALGRYYATEFIEQVLDEKSELDDITVET